MECFVDLVAIGNFVPEPGRGEHFSRSVLLPSEEDVVCERIWARLNRMERFPGVSGNKPLDPDSGVVVRAEGLEPSRTLRSNGFSYHPRLSPPPFGVCGLDYPFTVAFAVGAARLVSTPSQPVPAGLGSGSPCYRVPRI